MSESDANLNNPIPNPANDGEDYCRGGKFVNYWPFLQKAREQPLPIDTKLRCIKFLKEKFFPFLHRSRQLREQEAQELKATFEKFNGPEAFWKAYAQEAAEMMACIAAFGDDELTELLDSQVPTYRPDGDKSFDYDHGGKIFYRSMIPEVGMKEKGTSGVKPPAINLIPFGADEGMPYHHNMNPDDDLSLNPKLVEVLHRVRGCRSGHLFISFEHETRPATNYLSVGKPRCLSFIEQGLISGPSIGYGATAFFNDMLLMFDNYENHSFDPDRLAWLITSSLEQEMEEGLRAMGSVGEQLLAQYKAIKEQGPEDWADPERVYFDKPYNPHLPGYDGSIPRLESVKAAAWDQLKMGRQRVQQLRARPSSPAPNAAGDTHTPAVDDGAPLSPKPAKRPHEDSGEDNEDGSARGAKRQRPIHGARPGPSRLNSAPPERAASKRPREPEDVDGNEDNEESDHSEVSASRASKRQRLTKAVAPTSLPATSLPATSPSTASLPATSLPANSLPATSLPANSLPATRSRASAAGSSAAVPQASSSKRARAPADAGNGDDDEDDSDSHGPSGSKRRRLIKGKRSAGLPHASPPHASPEAGPSTADRATHQPAAHVSDSSQARASSAAGQPAPQQPQQPVPVPSSQTLPSSQYIVTMAYISRLGKKRPWLFGYNTDSGYGIYTFVKCPECLHHFQRHPLKDNRAHDHFRECGLDFQDEQDMVLRYASQVIKDQARKSDLTIDWARKSNMTLLPSNEKANHPDNFPLPPANQ